MPWPGQTAQLGGWTRGHTQFIAQLTGALTGGHDLIVRSRSIDALAFSPDATQVASAAGEHMFDDALTWGWLGDVSLESAGFEGGFEGAAGALSTVRSTRHTGESGISGSSRANAPSSIPQALDYQEKLTHMLAHCRPLFEQVSDVESMLSRVASELGVPVGLISEGPTAAEKRFLLHCVCRS